MAISDNISHSDLIHEHITKKRTWGKTLLALVMALGLLWWFNGRNSPLNTIPTTQLQAPTKARPLNELGPFMNSSSAEVIKRFGFERLNFESGTTRLIPGSRPEINQIAGALKKFPKATVVIEGHTDNLGQEAANLVLSRNRAEVIKTELIKRGVKANRIEIKAMGSTAPMASNDSAEGRAKNRRIEIVIRRR